MIFPPRFSPISLATHPAPCLSSFFFFLENKQAANKNSAELNKKEKPQEIHITDTRKTQKPIKTQNHKP